MEELDMDVSLKVIVVGNGMVGKTSLISRFARGRMTDNYKKTIGTDFMEKEINIPSTGDTIKLMLWDTAGQEMFSQLTRSYYKGAGAVIFAFSTTDRESFLEIPRWYSKVTSEIGSDIAMCLIQNKIDLLSEATVKKEEVEELARKLNLKLYRICVKDNVLVSDVFIYLAERYLKNGGASSSQSSEAVTSIGEIGTSAIGINNLNPLVVVNTRNNNSSNNDEADSSLEETVQHNGDEGDNHERRGSGSSEEDEDKIKKVNNSNGTHSNNSGNNEAKGFKLTPLTVRTKGKKSLSSTLCTII